MEYAHRLRLDMTIHHFVDHVDMLALWPYLFINKIYATTDHNVSNWAKNLTDPEIIKDIILTIKTRGSLAYHNLILSLQQTNQHFLADLLGIDTVDNESRNLRPRASSASNDKDISNKRHRGI
ncbi:uncharacterized protein LOC117169146 isoform X6 [Belonocnema kinseyi]|nr:uncharacterized protein LOC117169146 isoform X6 [Belonocnema kinseyi]XP_033211243.1 uncharacterized protein LOC117169146 isoform X6 [Belonocnema kinseyi]XP_033211245.1 uncharacterized protein LOC117169146 isoform X6 [Belonocnema kinseyi]XP_033211246.1 uncharacterized protein LOC117169146 isoform X6 [Belonocnema kinseyi]